MSNRSQNDFIQAMVSENIITQVESAGIYTVMMDETTDTLGKEQDSLILRFVDKEENIQERLISVSCVTKTDAETLSRKKSPAPYMYKTSSKHTMQLRDCAVKVVNIARRKVILKKTHNYELA